MQKHKSIQSPVDRFIPRRAGESFEASNYYLEKSLLMPQNSKPPSTLTYLNYAHHLFNKKNYQDRLWKTLVPNSKKVLNFSEPRTYQQLYKNYESNQWPVYPRKNPLICRQAIILEMPDLDINSCHQGVDWGCKGYIASIYKENVHLWHPNIKVPFVSRTGNAVENCVRWQRSGTQFIVSFKGGKLGVTDVCKNKVTFITRCCRKSFPCTITSLESYQVDIIISGCSNGYLTFHYQKCQVQNVIKAYNTPICTIKLSCNDNYLVTSDVYGAAKIWSMPNVILISSIKNLWPKTYAWHPWKEPLLAVSGGLGNDTISVWNVNHESVLHSTTTSEDTIIDAMIFNGESGELVVSCLYQKNNSYENNRGKNVIEILSNLNTIVDAIEWHPGRVSYLLWGNGGTQLATAGSDESLCIWDFFGDSSNKREKPEKKKFSTNPIKNLNCFGNCIR